MGGPPFPSMIVAPTMARAGLEDCAAATTTAIAAQRTLTRCRMGEIVDDIRSIGGHKHDRGERVGGCPLDRVAGQRPGAVAQLAHLRKIPVCRDRSSPLELRRMKFREDGRP